MTKRKENLIQMLLRYVRCQVQRTFILLRYNLNRSGDVWRMLQLKRMARRRPCQSGLEGFILSRHRIRQKLYAMQQAEEEAGGELPPHSLLRLHMEHAHWMIAQHDDVIETMENALDR